MSLREDVIKRWFEKARNGYASPRQGLQNGLGGGMGVNFEFPDILISCWISLEALTCHKWSIDGVWGRLKAFSNHYQKDFTDIIKNPPTDFNESWNNLSTLTIRDMRPNQTRSVKIANKFKLIEVMGFIYQVRNNLFHGGKDVNEERDKKIIKDSTIVLFRILEKVLVKEGLA